MTKHRKFPRDPNQLAKAIVDLATPERRNAGARGWEGTHRIFSLEHTMSLDATSFYRSSNGDHWRLMHDSESGRRFVRHEANPSSGGHVSDIELSDFLSVEGSGPEHAALRRLLDAEAAGARTES